MSRTLVSPAPRASEGAASSRRWPQRLIVLFLLLSGVLTFAYAATSVYFATQLVVLTGDPLGPQTPADFGLQFSKVAFTSREDHLQLHGWFIPGVLPNGHLTTDRTLVVMHGRGRVRNDPTTKLINLISDLAHNGFAVLTFDARNSGESAKGMDGIGYFEYRDALGAVDYLRTGSLPYARPRKIGAWGISMGAVSMIYATAREPAIEALVSDSAFADIIPIYEREIPSQGAKTLPPLAPVIPALVPGALICADAIYGLNAYANRPADYVASIAPRPIFFIHADHDNYTPSSMMDELAAAASTPSNAHVQSWKVPGVYEHAEEYRDHSVEYVARVTAFYTAALGPDQSAGA